MSRAYRGLLGLCWRSDNPYAVLGYLPEWRYVGLGLRGGKAA